MLCVKGVMCCIDIVYMHTYEKLIFMEVPFCMLLFLGNSTNGSLDRSCASPFTYSFFFKERVKKVETDLVHHRSLVLSSSWKE